MTQKKYPPLKEMFAALPEGTLKSGDNAILSALSAAMKALREVPNETNVFTIEMRGMLLSRLKLSVAEVLEPHVPKTGPGRPRLPLKNESEAFLAALSFLSLVINDSWHLPSDERSFAGSRAALDKTYAALLAAADARKLDTKPLADTWSRMCEGIDAYATRTFSEAPVMLNKSTAGAQMNLVLKTLAREARG
jgi:hypothetical protein